MLEKLIEIVHNIDWTKYIDEDDEEGCGRFIESGYSAVVCTGFAAALAELIFPQHFPGVPCMVRGRWYEPGTYPVTKFCDGHDLCVVQSRYVVDVWPHEVEGQDWERVLDMRSSIDRDVFEKRYGPFCEYKQTFWKEGEA